MTARGEAAPTESGLYEDTRRRRRQPGPRSPHAAASPCGWSAWLWPAVAAGRDGDAVAGRRDDALPPGSIGGGYWIVEARTKSSASLTKGHCCERTSDVLHGFASQSVKASPLPC